MEFLLSHSWWGIPVSVALIILIIVRGSIIRKRTKAQYREDESTLCHFVSDLDSEEIEDYKDQRDQVARFAWLKKHHPEFLKAAERHHENKDYLVASRLDLKLVKGAYCYDSQDSAFHTYRQVGSYIPLSEYQEIVTERNDTIRIGQEDQLKEYERQAEARQKRIDEGRKCYEAATDHWNTFPEEKKSEFKAAKSQQERESIIGSAAGYSATMLTPAIMTLFFSNVSNPIDSSIDDCEADYSSYDSGSGNDSSSSYDSGSSFSSSDSGGGCD